MLDVAEAKSESLCEFKDPVWLRILWMGGPSHLLCLRRPLTMPLCARPYTV